MSPEENNTNITPGITPDGSSELTTPAPTTSDPVSLEQSLAPEVAPVAEQPTEASAPAEPAPIEPTPAEPAAAESAPVETAPAPEPVAAPAPSLDQVAADLASTATTENLDAPAEPSIAEPSVTEPVAAEPTPVEMPATEPVAEPVAAEPAPEISPEVPAAPEMPNFSQNDLEQDLQQNLQQDLGQGLEQDLQQGPQSDLAQPDLSENQGNTMSSADFTNEPDEQAPEDKPSGIPAEEEPPLQPADPVPGSIGSALAYSETAPDHSMPVPKPEKVKAPKAAGGKMSSIRLALIILVCVVLVAVLGVVIAFVVSNNSSKNSSTNTSTTVTPTIPAEPVISSLTCTSNMPTIEFEGETVLSNEALSSQVIAMYSDDELTSFGVVGTMKYETTEEAEAAAISQREEYEGALAENGVLSDPFDSSYNVVDNTLTVTHQADAGKINARNAEVLSLPVENGKVITDIDELAELYESTGLITCVKK